MSMKFEYESVDGSIKTIVEIPSDVTIEEALQAFEQFLRGSGYYPTGQLDFVEPWDAEETEEKEEPVSE